MAKLQIRRTVHGIQYWFWCPACQEFHIYDESWKFNGDMEKPSFSPSLRHPDSKKQKCHLWIKDGIIEYFVDCNHALAGYKIPMSEIPEKKQKVAWSQ